MKYFNESKENVLKDLSVNEETGLTTNSVEERKLKYGLNEFSRAQEGSLLDDIKEALTEPMMIILMAAALISALIGEVADAIGIVCAVALGIAIGIVTEGKSKKAAEALSKLTENVEVKVLRDGKVTKTQKSDLVPGDIVYIETGDLVPSDGRLIDSLELKLREDMLTGESEDVSKDAEIIVGFEEIESKGQKVIQDPIPAKQKNMVFGGTLVAYGRGTMVVTSTGDSTEMGKIAQNLGENDVETPLQVKLGNLGKMIAKAASAIAALLFIFIVAKMVLQNTLSVDTSGIVPFLDSINPAKTALVVCIALIVAAVPEGLPTMVNMTLAITMQKMAKINALVTKKEACETIGSISVICSDKTGTLTQNRMTVETVYVDGKFTEGSGAESKGFFLDNCMLNSTADIAFENNEYKYLGSATECALLLKHKDIDYVTYRKDNKVVSQVPFSSKEKRMSTIIEKEGQQVLLSKGAPEVLLELCKLIQVGNEIVELTEERKNAILEEIKGLQVKAMRTLGFAYKKLSRAYEEAAFTSELEGHNYLSSDGLIFTGFVGIRDPLRVDVKEAVEVARNAGVTTKMLTGDNINTAIAIGTDLGLLQGGMKAVEATYIDTLTDEELKNEIMNIAIVARSKPDTKMRIVNALQELGEVVGVTGDGINDAPALNKADVGIAMGIAGTEVSKSAADIILTDDSFSTIVRGIQWGRGIYENFQRFIQFQLTVNIVAFMIAIISQLLGKEMPFTTIQLLWVNIIMDGPPALALGLEPVRRAVLNRKPVNRNASIITKKMITSIILNASYITLLLMVQMIFNPLGVEIVEHTGTGFVPNEMETSLFGIFAFSALFNAFNSREFGLDSIFPNFTKNKMALKVIGITAVAQIFFTEILKDFFNAVSLSPIIWAKILLLASTVVIVNELVKFVLRAVYKDNSTSATLAK
ncbi:calcium-translocating P-type ATPase, PMCA-type [Clostridium cellulovorans]|uniref:P-type Ca(2+) transporter n=1 Tax=Clostridium cellulovorans (strain ATCC 35296 / DSM 3052 / OCM 3 / 743B) TaxID=573061 RepID=D9SKY1_CLOC7|nr:calcium-translocating P-type ATPase, PMCA-type [Clostridium cellulovorans]ADL53553.1 calcium-translocating P-type ATPase, PMCA-type [Clostridium cellulovorans 743B]